LTYDAILILDELNLLEIRLRELSPVVDRFVIVESDRTFTGHRKPQFFEENRARFREWESKIIHVPVSCAPEELTAHERDTWTKERVVAGLKTANDDDAVIFSDIDEIPRASVVKAYSAKWGVRSLSMTVSRFYLDWQIPHEEWHAPKIMPAARAREGGLNKLRYWEAPPVIPYAGWHFTSTGGGDKLAYKLKSFAHADMPHNDAMVEAIRSGGWEAIYGNGGRQVEIDASYPRFVQDNIPLMRQWGLLMP
jgi:beta-1,4-mannosyl-glycoprotein beta-1,4-N-acetylglucosaminyltransferase